MGSKRSRPRDFTHSRPKPTRRKRKSATPKSSKLRTRADVLRDAQHSLRETRFADLLPDSPTSAVREARDGVPATALRHIRRNLEVVQSSAIVVAHALKEQNCLVDDDAQRVLRHHVSNVLMDQIENIDFLLGEGEEVAS